jgi:hypothetical protein
MALIDDVQHLVARQPGLTETQLAKALFGPTGYAQQVNGACRSLVRRGLIVRYGKGYSEPFIYHPVNPGIAFDNEP